MCEAVVTKDLSVMGNLRKQGASGWGGSGIDGIHVDGTLKRIIIITAFIEG
jgi:hypothetical protein